MAFRNIDKIILYSSGLIVCRDAQGRQAPPLQGMFWDVIEKLQAVFKPEDVSWCVMRDGQTVELPFEEWLNYGNKLDKKPLESRPISTELDSLIVGNSEE